MHQNLTTTIDPDAAPLSRGRPSGVESCCFHCGLACRGAGFATGDKIFCCRGCQTVFELLTENGLTGFYQLSAGAGVRVKAGAGHDQYAFLDATTVRERLVDYADERITRVTFHLPAMHCLACVWLLENLFRLKPGIGQSQVNFPRKEVAITFDPAQVKLSDVATLLASLGYEPELKFSDLEARPLSRLPRRLWLQLGVAGFAFGNTMLFSIAGYLGLDAFTGPDFKKMVGIISFLLSIPVVGFSALDYWRSAWVSLRQRLLNIDVPIAAGIVALFTQSCYEVFGGRGDGYFDSLAGLLFFLLCGKLFQQKTYDRLAFDRDYKSFFPLSITRLRSSRREEARDFKSKIRNPKSEKAEERVSLSQLSVGDRLVLRNGELIPADARLTDGPALVDYSFVTGESEPVEKKPGDYLYAGGRQIGGAVEVEMVKPVSQSYLTSLWNQDTFRKQRLEALNAITNDYSQRFTRLVIAIALGSALFWAFAKPAVALKAFTSVLIVACPCALALAAPFALGTAQRVLGRRNVFLKNPYIIEALARVDTVVFDKTGTLTAAGAGAVAWQGPPLDETEERWVYSMTRHSTHPLPVRVGEAIAHDHFPDPVRSFLETAGCGMEGSVAGHEIWMGSAAWLEPRGVAAGVPPAPETGVPPGGRNVTQFPNHSKAATGPDGRMPAATGSTVHVAIDGRYRGCFVLASALRPETDHLIEDLSTHCKLALLSGDNEKEQERFASLFGARAGLHFNQSPLNKLGFIRELQKAGQTVMMVGDGLNDAGALKQSDVGVAVVENVSAFSPASDVILAAGMVPRLANVLRFSRQSMRVVRAAFLISSLYNVVGIGIAASGKLSPVVCAILMPLSSVTVAAFACGATSWLGRANRLGANPRRDPGPEAQP
jgi:Cu+-exporting ATPase